VELSQLEREELDALLRGGSHAARKLKRAQILLAANEGVSDEVIAATLQVSGSTIYRTKRRLVEANLEGALNEEPRPYGANEQQERDEVTEEAVCSRCQAQSPKPEVTRGLYLGATSI
jgi:transposase